MFFHSACHSLTFSMHGSRSLAALPPVLATSVLFGATHRQVREKHQNGWILSFKFCVSLPGSFLF